MKTNKDVFSFALAICVVACVVLDSMTNKPRSSSQRAQVLGFHDVWAKWLPIVFIKRSAKQRGSVPRFSVMDTPWDTILVQDNSGQAQDNTNDTILTRYDPDYPKFGDIFPSVFRSCIWLSQNKLSYWRPSCDLIGREQELSQDTAGNVTVWQSCEGFYVAFFLNWRLRTI